MKKLIQNFRRAIPQAEAWSKEHVLGMFVFNCVLVLLLLLRSAGYFSPFFPLTINFIIFVCLVLLIFLLNAKSKTLILIANTFLFLTAFFTIFRIGIWAERTGIYFFQALVLGIILFILESRDKNGKAD